MEIPGQFRLEINSRVVAVCEFPAGVLLPRVDGWRFIPAPPGGDGDWRDWKLVDGRLVLNPRSLDLEPIRLLAEQRIAEHAARAMEHVRPTAAARVDAVRVQQAELALAAADEYGDACPLLGGAGSLHERARAVLAAAQATAERLTAIDVARRAAKTRIRAATTTAEIAAVTLETPQ